jgi:hypothetical protein
MGPTHCIQDLSEDLIRMQASISAFRRRTDAPGMLHETQKKWDLSGGNDPDFGWPKRLGWFRAANIFFSSLTDSRFLTTLPVVAASPSPTFPAIRVVSPCN